MTFFDALTCFAGIFMGYRLAGCRLLQQIKRSREKELFDMENKQEKGGLNKSLKLIFVYTVATGSIFTFVNYWDSVFYGYCGSGTFLAFALMTVAILPIALVYSELASLFHTSGGELIYNSVGINKHVGFFAAWLIMAAWISVPPAVVMAIMTWVNKTLNLNLGTWPMVGCAAVLLVLYFFMSIQNVQLLVTPPL